MLNIFSGRGVDPPSDMQRGKDFFAYTLKKNLPFAFLKLPRPSKAKKELFVEKLLLIELWLDTFELKNTKSDQSVWLILIQNSVV